MDLEIYQGRRGEASSGEIVRELAEADLALLSEPRNSPPSALKRIRDSHHALARALASGMSRAEASIACGYSPGTITLLQTDPAFQELLAFYRDNANVAYTDFHERLSTVSKMALDEIRERLEERPEEIGINPLIEIVKTTADRTGFGPKSTQVNVNLDLADRLQAARRRARLTEGEEPCKTIEHQASHSTPEMGRSFGEAGPNEEPVA